MSVRARGHYFNEIQAGSLTVINLSPIDVGYGLLMVSAFGMAFAGQGIAAALLAVVVANLVPTAFRRVGQLFSGPRPAQTLLIAELLRQLMQAGETDSFAMALFYVALCTSLAGLLQWSYGTLRLGGVLKYLPVPVIAGYLNAVALLILWPAFLLLLGFQKGATLQDVGQNLSLQTGWNVLFAAILLSAMAWVVIRKIKKIHWSVIGLFGGTALYSLLAFGMNFRVGTTLPDFGNLLNGWVFPVWPTRLNTVQAGWQCLWLVFPFALAISVLNAIEALVASARAEELSEERNDSNQVLKALGVANLIGGALGALPSAPSVSRVGIAWELDGRHRLSLWVSALTGAGLIALGGHFLKWVPYTVVGALMAFLAWSMVDQWSHRLIKMFRQRKKLERSLRRQVSANAMVMLLVIAVALSGHLIAAMFTGALLAMFLFVRDYSRSVIGRSFSGAHRHSLVMRTEPESNYLDLHGHEIQVLELNAPIVFGSADRLLDHLASLRPDVRHLILDFQRVREIDDKGAAAIIRLARRLAAQGIALHLAHLRGDGPRGSTLHAADQAGVLQAEHWHEDTDRALEYVESSMLHSAHFEKTGSMNLRVLNITEGMSEIEMGVLHQHLGRECFGAGQTVFLRGEVGEQLYILDSGQVEIQLSMNGGDQERRRIAAFTAGVVFGEMAMFGGGLRSADAIATAESAVWTLSSSDLLVLQSTHPAVAGKLMCNIARQLAVRLAVTNDELVYATRI